MSAFFMTTEAQTLETILSKHFEARGGLEYIRSLQSVIMRGRSVSGSYELPIRFFCIHQQALRVELDWEGKTYFQTGTRTEGWSLSPNQEDSTPVRMTPEGISEGIQHFDLQGPFIEAEKKGNKITFTGIREKGGKTCFEIKVQKASGTVIVYYLDESYQIFQTVEKGKHSIEPVITTYENYQRQTNGLVFPLTWSVGDSKTHIDSVEINPDIELSFFQVH